MTVAAAPDGRPPSVLETALRSERTVIVGLVVFVTLVSWLWIVAMARDMYGPMTGASAWMMTPAWDGRHLALLWAMWAVMMTGMMLPSASPLVLMYGIAARQMDPAASGRLVYVLAAGYLAVWGLFSLGATALQRVLSELLLLSPMMEASRPAVGGMLLVFAGIYQFTPLKRMCLHACQSPFAFLMTRWRRGWRGAFGLGVQHGIYCVGCCWALMLLLFAGGVMNLVVIGALTAFVAIEKLGPQGLVWARVSGAALVALGAWMLAR